MVLKILHLLPRLMSSLLMTHMHYDYVHKSPHCLLTIRTYSFSGQFKERGSNYYNSNFWVCSLAWVTNNCLYWISLWLNCFVFCTCLLLEFCCVVHDCEAAQCLQINFVFAPSRGGGAFSWSFVINYTIIPNKSLWLWLKLMDVLWSSILSAVLLVNKLDYRESL